jgi:hypothetical protein
MKSGCVVLRYYCGVVKSVRRYVPSLYRIAGNEIALIFQFSPRPVGKPKY